MHQYTTIFFDWGGVVSNDPGDDFLRMLLTELGATPAQVEEIYETYMRRFMRGELSESEYWQELRSIYGLTIHDSISEEFKRWQGLTANDDILNLVTEAKQQGLRTAVLSNVIEPTYNVIAAAGYYDYFDEVIASWQVGSAKPEPEIYKIALQQLETTAEASIFIDDKQKCLAPAAAMGFKTILAENPEQIIRDVRACWS
jgi:putative hydrolase of the HAD superfamily